jgi:hypothetical protein
VQKDFLKEKYKEVSHKSAETWWEWNEQSPGLVMAQRAEDLAVILDQTDAAHHKCSSPVRA